MWWKSLCTIFTNGHLNVTPTAPVVIKRCKGKHKKVAAQLHTMWLWPDIQHPNNSLWSHLTILQHSCARPATFKMILTRCHGVTSCTHTRDVYQSMNLHISLWSHLKQLQPCILFFTTYTTLPSTDTHTVFRPTSSLYHFNHGPLTIHWHLTLKITNKSMEPQMFNIE